MLDTLKYKYRVKKDKIREALNTPKVDIEDGLNNLKSTLLDIVLFKKYWRGWQLFEEAHSLREFIQHRLSEDGYRRFRFSLYIKGILNKNDLILESSYSHYYTPRYSDKSILGLYDYISNSLKLSIQLDDETAHYLKSIGKEHHSEIIIPIAELLEITGENLIDEAVTLKEDLEGLFYDVKDIDIVLDSLEVKESPAGSDATFIIIEGKLLG